MITSLTLTIMGSDSRKSVFDNAAVPATPAAALLHPHPWRRLPLLRKTRRSLRRSKAISNAFTVDHGCRYREHFSSTNGCGFPSGMDVGTDQMHSNFRDDKPVGYLCGKAERGSLYDKVGLRKGDNVTEIGGHWWLRHLRARRS